MTDGDWNDFSIDKFGEILTKLKGVLITSTCESANKEWTRYNDVIKIIEFGTTMMFT